MKKASHLDEILKSSQNDINEFDSQKNKLFNFPFLEKKERLDMPKLSKEYISIPDMKHFDIEKQETPDTCGLCSAEMVVNTLLKGKKVDEGDVIKTQITPNLEIFKKTVGIFPSQLQFGIQDLIGEYKLPYTVTCKHFMSYDEIKNAMRKGSYLIFSHMGDAINNPYNKQNDKKNPALKDIHNPHYLVLLSIDELTQKVVIANPFGYKESIDFKEFRERISLYPKYLNSNKIYLPLVESGLYMPRSCVIITPNA